MMKNKTIIQCLCVLLCLALPALAAGEEKPEVKLQPVTGNLYYISGAGGNIGVLKSETGLLVIDAGYANLSDAIMEKLASISKKPVQYLVNTHYHGDHTAGNGAVNPKGVFIMTAQCKASLVKNAKEKLPYLDRIKTFDKEKIIKFGGETVKLVHFGNGHTAGDTVVIFEKAKVIHPGDLFFENIVPYIDVNDGSDTVNWMRTIAKICKTYPGYRVIPGHGELTDTEGFKKMGQYLKQIRNAVESAVKAGKTREEAVNSIEVEGFEWMKDYKNFMTRKTNVGWVYDEVTRDKK